jgi:hypothetical protein
MLGFPQGRRDAPRSKATCLIVAMHCQGAQRRDICRSSRRCIMGELLGGKDLLLAGRFSRGTLIGTTAGIIGKFSTGLLMVWFLAAAFIA